MDAIRKIEEPVSVEEQWSRSPERCWTAMPATLNNEPCVKGLYKAALYQQAVAKLKHEELEQAYKSWRMDRALIADREAELAEAGLKYVSLFGELQNAMAEIERLKADAMRYRLLRMYKVHGYWPRELEHNPGILAFTAGYDDSRTYTLGRLDELLDEMLGVGVTDELIKERGWRADYREYKAERVRLVFSQVYSGAALTTTTQPTE